MPMKIVRFKVKGSDTFPFDMLRYDSCYPSSQEDVAKLFDKGQREITLVYKTMGTKQWIDQHYPTNDRWASFNWTVTDVAVHA